MRNVSEDFNVFHSCEIMLRISNSIYLTLKFVHRHSDLEKKNVFMFLTNFKILLWYFYLQFNLISSEILYFLLFD